MTPKEKAKELYGKFEKLVIATNGDSWTYESKECALVTVDEVISCYNWPISELRYWQNVREEIEKL